eukprot:scaffold78420_cov57-Phaeocystis_antarctica.AAC.1
MHPVILKVYSTRGFMYGLRHLLTGSRHPTSMSLVRASTAESIPCSSSGAKQSPERQSSAGVARMFCHVKSIFRSPRKHGAICICPNSHEDAPLRTLRSPPCPPLMRTVGVGAFMRRMDATAGVEVEPRKLVVVTMNSNRAPPSSSEDRLTVSTNCSPRVAMIG